ncbi:MAG: CoA transferase [Chloroflexi bacterium]|nr:CoA transferase [Chloroflexota bacterium]
MARANARRKAQEQGLGPLAGVNIVDMGVAGVGPWAATILAWLGANVVRVEPPFGDMLQNRQSPYINSISTAYTMCNLNKRSAILDLRDKSNWAKFEKIIREADVVMENHRADRLATLGVTFDSLKAINPRIIYFSCPGYGYGGPMRDWFCADPHAQALSGFASLAGPEGSTGEMFRLGGALDFNASVYIAAAVLLALLARERTGLPQRITMSQLSASMSIQISRIAEYLIAGVPPVAIGSASSQTAPHEAFLCEDKRWLAVGCETQKHWEGLCRALKREDLLQDPRFATNADRVKNRKELASVLQEVFKSKHSRWLALQLEKQGVPRGYFLDYESLWNHVHFLENEFFAIVDHPRQGKMRFGGLPWRFSRGQPPLGPAPIPGQHTEEVLAKGMGSPAHGAAIAPRDGIDPAEPPLKGMKVVDVSQGLCGPYVSLLLADHGAEVIKVEPPEGDYARTFAPQHKKGVSAAFVQLNHSKKSVTMDLSTEAGRADLKALLKDADVFIEDWGPDVAEEMGFGYTQLSRANKGLLYCALSYFGEKGPLCSMPGSELVVQATAGAQMFLGRAGEPPLRHGCEMASLDSAVFAFQGILAALFRKMQDGLGQRLSVSQLGVMTLLETNNWAAYSNPAEWNGHCLNEMTEPRGGIRTKDGILYFSFNSTTEEMFNDLIKTLGMEEALSDPRFMDPSLPFEARAFSSPFRAPDIWERYLKNYPTSYVTDLIMKAGGSPPPFNSTAGAINHPQIQSLNMVKEIKDPYWGRLRLLRPPWSGSWKDTGVKAPPRLGQHTREVAATSRAPMPAGRGAS